MVGGAGGLERDALDEVGEDLVEEADRLVEGEAGVAVGVEELGELVVAKVHLADIFAGAGAGFHFGVVGGGEGVGRGLRGWVGGW